MYLINSYLGFHEVRYEDFLCGFYQKTKQYEISNEKRVYNFIKVKY